MLPMTYPKEEDENYKNYILLCQIDSCARYKFNTDNRYLEKLLQRMKNVNFQVPTKSTFVLHKKAEFIGKTILNLTYTCSSHTTDDDHCKFIQLLLDYKADPTIKDALGLTALIDIVIKCEGKYYLLDDSFECGCMSRFLSAQVALNKPENPCNEHDFSHFHVACMANHSEAVQFFLNNGVNVNKTVSMNWPIFAGYSPLHFAVKFRALETVKILIENGADLLQKNKNGLTPVHQLLERSVTLFNSIYLHKECDKPTNEVSIADIEANEKMMNLFLTSPRIHEFSVANESGLSVLHLACSIKNKSLIEQLLANNKVDIDQTIHADSLVCPGSTPLHFAAMFNFDIAMMLLEKGADLMIKNTGGQTPLDICLEKYSAEDIHGILSTQRGWKNIVMSDGQTKLLDIVQSMQDPTLFERFVDGSEEEEIIVSLDAPLWPGYTLLHLAVTFVERQRDIAKAEESEVDVDLTMIKKFLNCNPESVNSQDARGSTPLHLAFIAKKLRVVNILLRHCEEQNPVNENNLSHLHIASAVGHSDSVKSLIKNKCMNTDVSSNYTCFYYDEFSADTKQKVFQITRGQTAMHIAMAAKNYKAAESLLEHGADLNSVDGNGMTAIHWLMLRDIDRYQSKEYQSRFVWSHPDLRDVVVKDIGLSHLHVAVYFSYPQAVERLLKLGADANATISNQLPEDDDLSWYAGYTPLHFLKVRDLDNDKILDLLLRYGADVLAVARNELSMLKEIFVSIKCTRIFLSYLKENEAEQSRVRKLTGLTILHVACYVVDLDTVENIIRNGSADVNAQVHEDSQFWPGCTPLHTLILGIENSSYHKDDEAAFVKIFARVCELLLKNGADVGLWSNDYGTPMHAAMQDTRPSNDIFLHSCYRVVTLCVRAMLDKYADYSKNLMNINGISLFHVACQFNVVTAARKFLMHGVDINEPIDKFLYFPYFPGYAGQTPLHLCITRQYSSRMLDLLLKHGANVHAETALGDTPLHIAALICPRRKILEKFVAAGANVNAENVCGDTPLEYALCSDMATARDLKFFWEQGHSRCYFNKVTQLSFISHIFEEQRNERRRWSLFYAMRNAPGFCDTDELGRTALHRLVACQQSDLTHLQYVVLIEDFIKEFGCDIDIRNNAGQTALHYATYFLNAHAVSALLLAGADINIADDKGDTAYTCALNSYAALYGGYSLYEENRESVIKILVNHVRQLQHFDLHVNKTNIKIQRDLIEQGYSDISCSNDDPEENMLESHDYLLELKEHQIGISLVKLSDFLTDKGLIFAYPTMPLEDCKTIDGFFEANNSKVLEDTFGQYAKLLKLQYRKAMARKPLLESARNSLLILTRYLLPELCAHAVVKLLTNDDLKNTITSTNEFYPQ